MGNYRLKEALRRMAFRGVLHHLKVNEVHKILEALSAFTLEEAHSVDRNMIGERDQSSPVMASKAQIQENQIKKSQKRIYLGLSLECSNKFSKRLGIQIMRWNIRLESPL